MSRDKGDTSPQVSSSPMDEEIICEMTVPGERGVWFPKQKRAFETRSAKESR